MNHEDTHQCANSSLKTTSHQLQWLMVLVGIHSQEMNEAGKWAELCMAVTGRAADFGTCYMG